VVVERLEAFNMRGFRRYSAVLGTVLCLGVMSTAAGCAAPRNNGNGHENAGGTSNGQNGNGNAFRHDNNQSPNLAATPELDSLLLFGSGTAGLAGYALTRVRAGRRQDRSRA
jgi:hypothetical protein